MVTKKVDIPNFLWLDQMVHEHFVIRQDYIIEYPEELKAKKCYEELWAREEPCEECQMGEILKDGKTFLRSGKEKNDRYVRDEYRAMREDMVLCTRSDQSEIVSVLRKTKSLKERVYQLESKAKAEKRIIQHKLSMANKAQQQSQDMLDGVTSSILFINDQMEVERRNKNVEILLEDIGNMEHKGKKCFEILYSRKEVCQQCPLVGKGIGEHKITQKIGDCYLTEEMAPQDNGVVLTISNSTRTIELAFDIQKEKREMQRINKVLHQIMDAGLVLQSIHELDEIFEAILNKMEEVFYPGLSVPMVFLLYQRHREQVEHVAFKQVAESDQKEYTHRLMEFYESGLGDLGFSSYPIKGMDHESVGALLVQSPPLDDRDYQILGIFLNMVASLIENRRLLTDLEKQANTDGLTGAFNRAYFDSAKEQAMVRTREIDIPFGVIVIDINGLKKVNDVYGHSAGDALIKASCDLLNDAARENDIMARFGGDEFVVLLPSTDLIGTKKLCNRIQEMQKEATFQFDSPEEGPVTLTLHMSVGYCATDEIALDQVFHTADERMYADKEAYYKTHERYR